jgi:hypothetical protein
MKNNGWYFKNSTAAARSRTIIKLNRKTGEQGVEFVFFPEEILC